MDRKCAGIKRDGGRCTVSVPPSVDFCYLHDPERADERRRIASRAGSSRPDKELSGLRAQLQEIGDGVLEGYHDPRRAAVAVQALQAKGRILELARRWKEVEEFEERLRALEEQAERRGPRGRAR